MCVRVLFVFSSLIVLSLFWEEYFSFMPSSCFWFVFFFLFPWCWNPVDCVCWSEGFWVVCWWFFVAQCEWSICNIPIEAFYLKSADLVFAWEAAFLIHFCKPHFNIVPRQTLCLPYPCVDTHFPLLTTQKVITSLLGVWCLFWTCRMPHLIMNGNSSQRANVMAQCFIELIDDLICNTTFQPDQYVWGKFLNQIKQTIMCFNDNQLQK